MSPFPKHALAVIAIISCLSSLQAEDQKPEMLPWRFDYAQALAESKETGKPIFLEFRCVPCINGREFDAQVVFTDPNSSRGKLMSQYVLARINSMTAADIAHYDRDWHNSLYYFIINAEEDIYLRYGGRDEKAADTYLDYESLERALEIGLEEQKKYLAGERSRENDDPRPPRLTPEDHKLVQVEVIEKGRCTECHLVGDFSMQEKEMAGLLDPITDLYRSPDIKAIGLHLDVPKGLVLASVDGPAAEAGIKAGDKIVAFEGRRVLTFGDLQHRYDKVPRRTAKSVTLTVDRGGETVEATVQLPFEWWRTGLEFRHWNMQPQLFFKSEPLTAEEKQAHRLPADGFAARVTEIDLEAALNEFHTLEIDDIIVAVGKAKTDPMTTRVEDHIVLHYPAESEIPLTVLRGEETEETLLKTQRLNFRKYPIDRENVGLMVKWSEPDYVRRGNDRIVRYRAAIANGHLLVEATHEPDWHSYAMDNPQRSAAASKGSPAAAGSHELPTVIQTPDSLATGGSWKQTPPTDYSKPGIHWYTYGFSGISYFALPLKELPKEAFKVSVTSQVCDTESCAGTFELELEVPIPNADPANIFTKRIIDALETVEK